MVNSVPTIPLTSIVKPGSNLDLICDLKFCHGKQGDQFWHGSGFITSLKETVLLSSNQIRAVMIFICANDLGDQHQSKTEPFRSLKTCNIWHLQVSYDSRNVEEDELHC